MAAAIWLLQIIFLHAEGGSLVVRTDSAGLNFHCKRQSALEIGERAAFNGFCTNLFS